MRAIYVVLIGTILSSTVVDAADSPKDFAISILGERDYENFISNGNPLYDDLIVMPLGHMSNKTLEEKIYDSLQQTRNFFGEMSDPLKVSGLVMKSAAFVPKDLMKKAAKFIPFASRAIDLADTFAAILNVESDWKGQFAKEFENLMPPQQVSDKSLDIRVFLETVKQDIPIMNATIYKNAILKEKLKNRNRSPQEKHQNYHRRHNQRLRQHIPLNPQQRKFQKPKRQNNGQSQTKLLRKVETLEIELKIVKGNNGALPTNILTFFQNYVNLINSNNSIFNHAPLLAAPILIEFSCLFLSRWQWNLLRM